MASGFPRGGGRSIHGGAGTNGDNNPPIPHPTHLPGMLLDQIGNRTGAGKRPLSEFQSTAAINALLLRTVKPRTYQNLPVSRLRHIDLSACQKNSLGDLNSTVGGGGGGSSQRYGLPSLQHMGLRNRIGFGSNNPNLRGVLHMNQGLQNRVQPESVKTMNQLKELEKQLLDDDENDEAGAVSVITNTSSEWSETIQSLLNPKPSPNPNLVSSSPTSSSSSSSSSSSAVSQVTLCSRQTIMELATAISEGKTDYAAEILARISTPNPKANSERKLLEFMVFALRSRVNTKEHPAPVKEFYGNDHMGSTQPLYELSPCFKLGLMAANLAILETIDGNNSFHVVDFNIGQGRQYVNLLHALRAGGQVPKAVRITAVVDNNTGEDGNDDRLKKVGELLSRLGEQLGVCLKFNVVVSSRLGDVSRDSLGCDPDEPLAVNLAFKLYRIPDESVCTTNPRDELLRRVKSLAPRVVTLVEQEMNANTAPFVARVGEVCAYYGALLESVESTVPSGSADRAKVEEGLSRKLVNSVACEGRERMERCEVFGKWKVRMGMAGFQLMPLSQGIGESMKARLNRVHPGFTVKEDNGGICFGWNGRTLTVASAWW